MASKGNILAGFVKGFSGTTLKGLERREEEEREIRKAKLLNDLRLATEKEMTIFKENTPLAKEERERARSGETRAQALHERTFDRDAITDERWQLEFDQRARQHRESLAAYSRSGRGGKGDKDGDNAPPTDVANELMYRYEKEVDELIGGEAGAPDGANRLSRVQIRNAAIAIADNTDDEVKAQREFAIWLDRQRRGMPRRKIKLDPTTK